MALSDYVILTPGPTSANVDVANTFSTTTVLENSRTIKTPAVYDEEGIAMISDDVYETDLECVTRIANGRKVVLANTPNFHVSNRFMSAAELPGDGEDNLTINWDTVANIKMASMRTRRDQMLQALDVPFMRAIETGDTSKQTAIGAKKQLLRDLPTQLTANLTSNSLMTGANTITRQTRIARWGPPELQRAFIAEFID